MRFPAHFHACIHRVYAVCECVHAHTSSSSTVTYTAVSQTGQLRVLKQSKTTNLFKSCLGAFSVRFLAVWMCLVSHLALLSLDIACIAVARPAKPVYEKWISPSLHCHGDAQLTRQFCPFKYLHQSCCSDGEVRNSLSRDWFHPLLSIKKNNNNFIFIMIWYTIAAFWVQCRFVCLYDSLYLREREL